MSEKLDVEKDELLWLERCLMEAMRLDPPIPITTVHETTQDTKLCNGAIIPKGTHFLINMFALHRDKAQYHEPEKFRPERFSKRSNIYLTPGLEQRHTLSWCPFMTGVRQCNGKELAFAVAKTVTSMYLAAMPQIDFCDEKLRKQPELPSSNPSSHVVVQCYAPVPFNI